MAEKMLEVNDLKISFRTTNGKVQAVRNISFDLYKGETLAIVGESGSGKSVTSRAILGILAGNAIVESGSIIYSGQDLLRISEDDFHKIRGDKISMIFQDPLSSLNPVVRIGKQLTEAMLLKNKGSRRAARRVFNSMLTNLKANMVEALVKEGVPEDQAKKTAAELTGEFNKFNVEALKLQNKYNEAANMLVEAESGVEWILLNIEKKQTNVDYGALTHKLIDEAKRSIHPFVAPAEQMQPIVDKLKSAKFPKKALPDEAAVSALRELNELVTSLKGRTEPNFFRIGYYKMHNPEKDIYSMPVAELNETAKTFLDEHFMIEFIKQEKKALKNAHANALEGKKQLLDMIEKKREIFDGETLDRKACETAIKDMEKVTNVSINRLDTVKDSAAYTFIGSLRSAVETYFTGIRVNPGRIRAYERQKTKYDRLIARNKTPDWKVTPAQTIDLELTKKNIRYIFDHISERYREDIARAESVNFDEKAVEFIDFMKNQAFEVSNKVTKSMARIRAIKLMEEVGIPEPEKRYRQYPFEFSGGMRQRIVIAIALSANPDILICDEPTTALDVTIQAQILELINDLKKKRRLSVIFITHNLGVVANMADRVAVMYAGKIVEYGDVNEIFYSPAHPYTWALLSSMPDLDTTDKLEAIPGTPPNMIYPPDGDAFAVRNKYALEIDFEMEPPMFEVSPTHYAATWLLHPDAPKVEMPKIIRERIARYQKEVAGRE